MNINPIVQNDGEWIIKGLFTLASGGAVTALSNPDGSTRTMNGDNMSVVKAGGTATYTVTLKGTANLKLVEVLEADANLCLGTQTTAFRAHVTAVTQSASTDDITITISLFSNASPPVAAETGAAISVSFRVTVRTRRMGGVI